MGYFNFYFIKKFFKYVFYNKKLRKILILFIIFIALLILKNKVFAVTQTYPYNSTYYIQIVNKSNNNEWRACCNVPFYMKPDPDFTDPATQSWYSGYTFTDYSRIGISLYRNGSPNYPSQATQTQFLGTIPYANKDNYTYSASFPTIIYSREGKILYDTYDPYIVNASNIPSWDFQYLQIDGRYAFSGTMAERSDYFLIINYDEGQFTLDIKPYMSYTDNNGHIEFNIPRYQIFTDYNIQGNEILDIYLKSVYHDPHLPTNQPIIDNYALGTYTLNLSSSEAGVINSNTSRQQLDNINNSVQQTTQAVEQTTQAVEDNTQAVEDNTQAVEHLEDTITDDTVETTADDLPSIDVGDPSQSGIDNIFQSIYNAFCTGQAQDIVFPIPFTNKNITLNPYYVRDMLNNNGAGWVYTLIQAFWGYLIGRYIVKDISKKITKVKSGNIENLENENIKEEML